MRGSTDHCGLVSRLVTASLSNSSGSSALSAFCRHGEQERRLEGRRDAKGGRDEVEAEVLATFRKLKDTTRLSKLLLSMLDQHVENENSFLNKTHDYDILMNAPQTKR